MIFRINLLLYCFAGCIISVLLALILMLKFDAPFLAFLPTLLFPALSCYIGGLRRRDTLVMIAVYATVGWFAGTFFTPAVAMGPQSQLERQINSPFVGRDPILPCAILGCVFAMGRTCFVGARKTKNNEALGEQQPSEPVSSNSAALLEAVVDKWHEFPSLQRSNVAVSVSFVC